MATKKSTSSKVNEREGAIMKKSTSRKVAKRVDPFVGIPEEERKQTAIVAAMNFYMDRKPMTPQEAWSWLQASRAREAAAQEKKDAEHTKQLAEAVRNRAIERLEPALRQLVNARDLMIGIEENLDGLSYMEHEVLAGLARLAISEAGSDLEQALCDLGLIHEQKLGYFVDNLKSDGIKRPEPEEEEQEAA